MTIFIATSLFFGLHEAKTPDTTCTDRRQLFVYYSVGKKANKQNVLKKLAELSDSSIVEHVNLILHKGTVIDTLPCVYKKNSILFPCVKNPEYYEKIDIIFTINTSDKKKRYASILLPFSTLLINTNYSSRISIAFFKLNSSTMQVTESVTSFPFITNSLQLRGKNHVFSY